jgi:tripartite-type tricarboxylate transporter receptor subunit TctC
MISRRALLATGAAFGTGIAARAAEPAYPNRSIKMIVPFAPGGPVDVIARMTAHHITTHLGQQVIIENRPGAGATLAYKAVAAAEPDGYTLLYASSGSLGIAPALYPNLDLEPLKAFDPIATTALLPHMMVAGPSLPVSTVAEFVAYAKAHPGQLNYGASLGTPPHLLATLFTVKAGLNVTYIPYKGSAPAVTDLLGGRTQFSIDGMLILAPLAKQGKVRPLAVARAERWPDMPNVPTLVESGFPDFVIDAWVGVVAPRGTPADILATLNAAINAGAQSEETRLTLTRFHALPKTGTPTDFAALIRKELPLWANMVKLAGAAGG